MAGYKQSVKNFNPVCFLTFDGSSIYNRGSGEIAVAHIPDESNNNHYGILQTNSGSRKSYSMGTTGLVNREKNADQASFTFAIRGYDTLSSFPYEKTLIEVLHTEKLKFNKDFTFMFMMRKYTDDSEFRAKKYDYTSESYFIPQYYNNRQITRQLFRKGSTIDMSIIYKVSLPTVLQVKYPGYIGEFNIPSDFHDKTYHVTMTHRVISVGSNLYRHERKVYLDGIEFLNNLSSIQTSINSAENTAPLEIGGNRDVSDPDYLNDRQTSPIVFDQFAVFDKALDADEIINLFKKVDSYVEFVKSGKPKLYMTLDDSPLNPSLNVALAAPVSTTNKATYSDSDPFIVRKANLTNRTMGESGANFQRGMVKYVSESIQYHSPVINASNDFTMSFWLSFTSSDRGVVVSCQSNMYPYKGILFEVNQLERSYKKGMLQVSLGDGIYLNPPLKTSNGVEVDYSDGVMRYYTIRRIGTDLELWIDGVRVSTLGVFSNQLIPDFGQMYIMGMAPGLLNVSGTFGHLEFYDRALTQPEIRARSYFHVVMLVKGRITVQGIPHRATIRVYDHYTGDLIKEGFSDSEGFYTMNVYSNNLLNIVYFDKFDNNIKSRIYGPLIAHEYADVEWW